MPVDARLHLHPAFTVGPVRPRLFGGFVEHMGRCVYGGIHDPGHPSADESGIRGDVVELLRELGVTTLRYPGGNFVSAHRWEDGVGPREQRPARRDVAWHSLEPHTVGLGEFMDLVRRLDAEPMLAINLGTRGLEAALDLLEYANGAPGTALADLRAAHGHPEPFGVRLWCLGNEMDGPWQIGHRDAAAYGELAASVARAMLAADARLELIACGSSGPGMATFPAWDRTVLEHVGDATAMISAHIYLEQDGPDLVSFLISADRLDAYLGAVATTIGHVCAGRPGEAAPLISLDEWGVTRPGGGVAPHGSDEWPFAPAIAEVDYRLADAVVVGNMLIAMLRNADVLGAANLAQVVNVLAPIRTETGGRSWRQTTFHPFALTARHARGEVLDVRLETPQLRTRRREQAAVVDAVATWDASAHELVVLAAHRGTEEEVRLVADLAAFGEDLRLEEALTLWHEDPEAIDTADDPDRVVPAPNTSATCADGEVAITLPPVSWTMLRLRGRTP